MHNEDNFDLVSQKKTAGMISKTITTILLSLSLRVDNTLAFAPTQPFLGSTTTRGIMQRTSIYYQDPKLDTTSPTTKVVVDILDPSSKQEETTSATPSAETTQAAIMEDLTKTRPFPIFVAEKMAGTMEGTARDLGRLISRLGPSAAAAAQGEDSIKYKKEKIVVLGVGWGSAAFLSGIDTDLYDVTVVSPRNHFIFTPST